MFHEPSDCIFFMFVCVYDIHMKKNRPSCRDEILEACVSYFSLSLKEIFFVVLN